MKAIELASKAEDIAQNYKTSYIWGGIGLPITEATLQRAANQYSKNITKGYVSDARRYLNQRNAFYFDCVGMVKAILWGWNGDSTKTYGGATYSSNGVPDISADQMITKCSGVSTDFSNIQVGELLWKSGHVGIYIGNGLGVECTPSWKNGVQITAVGNIGSKSGYSTRQWTKHGKLPYVTYTKSTTTTANTNTAKPLEGTKVTITLSTLKMGDKGDSVKALQILLNGYGCSCGTADGDFGNKTASAVKLFQRKNGLTQDGIVGANTWKALLT